MSTSEKSAFERLAAINVGPHTEKKNGLTYLSWAWAWVRVLYYRWRVRVEIRRTNRLALVVRALIHRRTRSTR